MRIGIGTSIVGQQVAGEAVNAFVTTWETTTPSETITLPLVSTGSYDFDVDWGDGSSDTITAYDQAEVTHTYATADTYTVSITGTIEGFRFANAGDKLKIKTIDSYGPLVITTDQSFRGCSNLTSTATDAPVISTTSLGSTFQNCTNFNGAIGNWDVSGVESFGSMFRGAGAFNADIGSWDTSSANIMGSMLRETAFNQDISSWNVSSVTATDSMFTGSSVFNQDISSWNVSSVTNMGGMFNGATSFNQNLGSWDVSGVTDMTNTFRNCDGMSDANLGAVKDWTITALTDASSFMDACTNSMSTSDYDALLIAWEAQAPNTGVSIDFNNATYTAGGAAETARTSLTTATPTGYGWTILDGGTA